MWSLTIPFTRRSRVDVTYGGPKFLVPPQILWMSQFSFFFFFAETSVFRRKRQKLKYWKNKNQTRKYFQSDIDNSYQVESYSSLRKFFTKEEFILMHPIQSWSQFTCFLQPEQAGTTTLLPKNAINTLERRTKLFLLPAKRRFHSTKKGRKKSPRMRKNVLLDFNKAKT